MRLYPAHEDLGLDPEADRTPDLRPGKSEAPKRQLRGASEIPSLSRDLGELHHDTHHRL